MNIETNQGSLTWSASTLDDFFKNFTKIAIAFISYGSQALDKYNAIIVRWFVKRYIWQ